ncbi:unnamed protein product [marine sediment metagenome]|uniref:Uncharacterized protein n=1 Tax=marine sediment metagenome TaxID=412755 RepID=X1JW38_9ZZZZ
MKEKNEARKLTSGIETGETKKGVKDMKEKTGALRCNRCRRVWQPNLTRGGRMPKGYRTCPYCGHMWTSKTTLA